ncbi:MAG: LysR substrate-binding domain-containing protein [Burkholderiaceae bacterium]
MPGSSVRSSIPKEWLKNQALLGGETRSGAGRLLRDVWGEDAKTISVSMQLGNTEAVKHAVQAGLGISLVMACSVWDEVRSRQLAALHIEGTAPAKQLSLVSRQGRTQNAAAHFIAFLLERRSPQGNTIPRNGMLEEGADTKA